MLSQHSLLLTSEQMGRTPENQTTKPTRGRVHMVQVCDRRVLTDVHKAGPDKGDMSHPWKETSGLQREGKAERANRGDKSHGHTPSSRVTRASRSLRLSLRLTQADGGQESQNPGQLEPGVQEDSPVSARAAGPAHPAEVSTHTSGHRAEARASCTEAPTRAGERKSLQAAPKGSATALLPSL